MIGVSEPTAIYRELRRVAPIPIPLAGSVLLAGALQLSHKAAITHASVPTAACTRFSS